MTADVPPAKRGPITADGSPAQTLLLTALTIGTTVIFLMHELLNSDMVLSSVGDGQSALELVRHVKWLPGLQPDGEPDGELLLAAVMAVSAFAQALTGFGFAIVSVGALSGVPWLVNSDLYELITPLAATLGAVVGAILLAPSASRLAWAEILPLLLPCTLVTPLGAWAGTVLEPAVATKVLALLILGFVGWSLAGMLGAVAPPPECASEGCALDEEEPPALGTPAAGYALGAMAGLFGGAFDVQGPPLVVFGQARGWSPTSFRDNILCVVAVNSAMVVALAQAEGKLHSFYYSYFALTSLPGVLLGVWLGQHASDKIDKRTFKILVLTMCLGLGLKLGFGA